VPDVARLVARIHNSDGLIALLCIQALELSCAEVGFVSKNFGQELIKKLLSVIDHQIRENVPTV
jgi:hypothetical protein